MFERNGGNGSVFHRRRRAGRRDGMYVDKTRGLVISVGAEPVLNAAHAPKKKSKMVEIVMAKEMACIQDRGLVISLVPRQCSTRTEEEEQDGRDRHGQRDGMHTRQDKGAGHLFRCRTSAQCCARTEEKEQDGRDRHGQRDGMHTRQGAGHLFWCRASGQHAPKKKSKMVEIVTMYGVATESACIWAAGGG